MALVALDFMNSPEGKSLFEAASKRSRDLRRSAGLILDPISSTEIKETHKKAIGVSILMSLSNSGLNVKYIQGNTELESLYTQTIDAIHDISDLK